MTVHLGTRPHIRSLEEAIEAIIDAAKAGNWEGDELPPTVGAAIAAARAVRDVERCRRGMPRYGENWPQPFPTPDLLVALRRRRCGHEH